MTTFFGKAMPKLLLIVVALLIAFSGCTTVKKASYLEEEDLMAVQHNEYNEYILLVYRDALGQTRHVLRQHGITEIVLTYTIEGRIKLKERGEKERIIKPTEAGHITQRINGLLNATNPGEARATST